MNAMAIRKALIRDIRPIKALIDHAAAQGVMLPRTLSELFTNVRDFFVAEDDGQLLGCVALHVNWEDLAEVKSLVVAETARGRGISATLFEALYTEATTLGIPRLFCLTFIPDYFLKMGFRVIDRSALPRKVWAECIHCVHYLDCLEVALVYDMPGARLAEVEGLSKMDRDSTDGVLISPLLGTAPAPVRPAALAPVPVESTR